MSRKKKPLRFIVGKKVEDLPVQLTQDEITERGQRLAAVDGEIESHLQREKEVKANLKATRSRLEAERSLLSMVVRNREEARPVRVTLHGDHEAGLVFEIRDDTGEVVRTRPLTDDDRQLRLVEEGPEL